MGLRAGVFVVCSFVCFFQNAPLILLCNEKTSFVRLAGFDVSNKTPRSVTAPLSHIVASPMFVLSGTSTRAGSLVTLHAKITRFETSV